jgi:hypothetical protein
MATGNRGERSKWPARINDVRSKFASDAPAAGVSVFELARIMGSSVRMIERHYGALLDGAGAGSPRDWMRSTRRPGRLQGVLAGLAGSICGVPNGGREGNRLRGAGTSASELLRSPGGEHEGGQARARRRLYRPRREDRPRRALCRSGRGPQGRGPAGVADVAGERGGRAGGDRGGPARRLRNGHPAVRPRRDLGPNPNARRGRLSRTSGSPRVLQPVGSVVGLSDRARAPNRCGRAGCRYQRGIREGEGQRRAGEDAYCEHLDDRARQGRGTLATRTPRKPSKPWGWRSRRAVRTRSPAPSRASMKRLMGFEPTTFCMASSADENDARRRTATIACKPRHSGEVPGGGSALRSGARRGRLGVDWAWSRAQAE